jgi:hypothetical protein
MKKLIISPTNILEFRPIAKSIPVERIVPYIAEAQQIDLKKLLGDALWLDFLTRFDNSVDSKYADYQKLLVGSTYTYGNITLENPGLIGYLSYMTLARFYANNQISATKYGIVQKLNEQSEQLDAKAIQNAITELRSNALALQTDIVKFLNTNGTLYPLYAYQDGAALGQNSAKFFDLNDNGVRNYTTRTSY